MPKKRPPREVWIEIRRVVWERDGRRCVRCETSLTLKECHIDHKISGKLGTNKLSNLRTLCRRCHVLRMDMRHRGMIAKALEDGIIPANWRDLVWED
ncbi:HNH endonuclease [Kroppenstedtia eburnea]|uniref:HNH endonuclease n=1 Tax=Kroppenstedtia eburnea TaxID=714067 RepID=UPI00363959FA